MTPEYDQLLRKSSRIANTLLQRSTKVAEDMRQPMFDSIHVAVAILESPRDFWPFSTHLLEDGMTLQATKEAAKGAFRVENAVPAVIHFTAAAKEMVRLVPVQFHRSHKDGYYGVSDIGNAALLSESIPLDRLRGGRAWRPRD